MKVILLSLVKPLFGLLFKHFGKRKAKKQLIDQIIQSVDTDGDDKVTVNDFAKGKWRDIDWVRLGIALGILVISLISGYMTFSLIDIIKQIF